MIKAFSAVILLFFLVPASLSFSQEPPGIKVYSGYLHHIVKNKSSFWGTLFGAKPSKQEEVLHDRQCSVEFKSPISFSNQAVSVVPASLMYSIKFKNSLQSSKVNTIKEKDVFEKFVIKIYTNDDQEYSIDPDSGDKIFDTYLIYLILGTSIDHIEVTSPSGDNQDKYVLDKLEIDDNH